MTYFVITGLEKLQSAALPIKYIDLFTKLLYKNIFHVQYSPTLYIYINFYKIFVKWTLFSNSATQCDRVCKAVSKSTLAPVTSEKWCISYSKIGFWGIRNQIEYVYATWTRVFYNIYSLANLPNLWKKFFY